MLTDTDIKLEEEEKKKTALVRIMNLLFIRSREKKRAQGEVQDSGEML